MNPVTPQDFINMMPLTVLSVAAMLLILVEAFTLGRRAFLMPLTVASLVAGGVAAGWLWLRLGTTGPMGIFGGMLIADRVAMFLVLVFCFGGAMCAMLIPSHQDEHDWENGETYGLLVLATAGMVMLAMAGDLVTVFLGIETMSLAVYVLCAARRRSRRSAEAAMKYFLMGAFATGFLLYGIALIYGAIGSTDLAQIASRITATDQKALLVVGMYFLIAAFGFKIAAVPFHMWTPDAYEGAPTPVTAYMAAVVKAAGVAGLIRVFGTGLGGNLMPHGTLGWGGILAVLAALTMTIGNLGALRQANVKRMLAYSSISHAGVILVGVVAIGLGGQQSGEARSAVLYYLAAYAVTTIGAFAVVAWIGSREHERVLVDDFAGLASARPLAALAMTVFMLSLGGMPPTAGFFGKFLVFKSAMQVNEPSLVWLVVIGVLNSVVSMYYYLRVVMAMYFRDTVGEFKPLRSGAIGIVLAVCAALVFQMGLMPTFWLGLTGR
jgi:NADH-quinone oxidoreductase subunit N